MNLFDQLRDTKVRAPYEHGKILQKIQHALLAAEDLILAVNNLELPAKEFFENSSVKNLFDAREKLGKLLMNEH